MKKFGDGDTSFLAAGGADGLAALVRSFYGMMDSLPEAKIIRAMHQDDLGESVEKLTVFLTGWLGGPKTYSTRFGPIRIPVAHKHLAIDEAARDAWMQCMRLAVAEQEAWSEDFREYFLEQIYVPAERVRQAAEREG